MDFSDLSTKTQRALERIPARHREDAAQEARLAELEGKPPGQAIKYYWRRERRYEEGQGSVAEAECPSVKVDHRNRKLAKCWRATQCKCEIERDHYECERCGKKYYWVPGGLSRVSLPEETDGNDDVCDVEDIIDLMD